MATRRRVARQVGACMATWVLATALGCNNGASVTVDLDKAANVPALGSVVVVIRDLLKDKPEYFGPINLKENPKVVLAAEVEPGTEFYVDVVGCLDPDRCEGDLIAARGCKDPMKVGAGEEATVQVTLFLNAGERDLPPQAGVDNPRNGCPPVGRHANP